MKVWGLAALAAVTATCAQAAPKGPKPVAPVLAAATACGTELRPLLERAVAIDSGSNDLEGVAAVGKVFGDELRALGLTVREVPSAAPGVGPNVVGTLTGTGKGRILLVPHMDTVFNRGDVAARKPHWEGDRYIGPGAGDNKLGPVTAICALKALKAANYRNFGRIDVLINGSEEVGSPGSRDLIRSMAKDSDAVIVLERGVPSDQALVARKGGGSMVIEVTGRAAHSGLEPEKGRNAVLEAARIALALGGLGDADKGTTVTVTIMSGGDKSNVVPAHARISADVRAFTRDEFTRVEAGARKILATGALDGTSATLEMRIAFPPWPRAASTEALFDRANRLYAEIGRKLTPVAVGGSGDASYAAESGVPVIDGMAMEGGRAHSLDDYADFATLTPRAYLLARMLMDLGADPPKP